MDLAEKYKRKIAFTGRSMINVSEVAMKLGELGEQFVLKSKKAFDKIQFISGIEVANAVYAPLRQKRDDNARAAYRAELEAEDLSGLFIRDIIKEGILPDDPRLQ